MAAFKNGLDTDYELIKLKEMKEIYISLGVQL